MDTVRKFESGAMRDTDDGKLDYEGFLSPLVLERYAQYLHKNRRMKDGSLRDSDNWQAGIPLSVYMKSLWRHLMDMWKRHRGSILAKESSYADREEQEDAICAVLFNASGYLHELLKHPLYLAPAEAATKEYPPCPSYGWEENMCIPIDTPKAG